MWSVGCIFGELILNAPLLPGSSEVEQLTFISALIGSPSPETWPKLRKLPLYMSFKLAHVSHPTHGASRRAGQSYAIAYT